MHYITKASYAGDYKLCLTFNDQKEGIVDLSDTIRHDHRRIFQELQDQEKFKKFRVEADTVVWENGLDLAPEYLYQKLTDSTRPTAAH